MTFADVRQKAWLAYKANAHFEGKKRELDEKIKAIDTKSSFEAVLLTLEKAQAEIQKLYQQQKNLYNNQRNQLSNVLAMSIEGAIPLKEEATKKTISTDLIDNFIMSLDSKPEPVNIKIDALLHLKATVVQDVLNWEKKSLTSDDRHKIVNVLKNLNKPFGCIIADYKCFSNFDDSQNKKNRLF